MYRFFKIQTLILSFLFLTTTSWHNSIFAQSTAGRVDRIVARCTNEIELLALDQRLINELKQHEPKSFVDILKIDKQWQDSPPPLPPRFATTSLNNLLEKYQNEHRLVVELIVTDSLGATLFAKPLSTDYWQGDESKFIEPATTNRTFIDALSYDESTRTFSVQISVPIISNDQTFLGVVVAGIEMPLDVVMDLPVSITTPALETIAFNKH